MALPVKSQEPNLTMRTIQDHQQKPITLVANPAIVKIIVPFNNWSFTAHLILFLLIYVSNHEKMLLKSLFYSMINRNVYVQKERYLCY